MSKIDACTKAYMSNPRFFSDAFNYYFFQDENVVKPEELTEQNITELVIPYSEEENVIIPAQKYRDILKMWTIMTSDKATYMLLGMENQANVHYAMPIRNMLYDALNYSSQVKKIGKQNRKRKAVKQDEFLSGFRKADKIKPIFTLVIYWGTKVWDGPRSLYEMFDIQEGMDEVVKKYVNDYYDVYSNFDRTSGNLLQVVTNTKLPKEAKKEDSVNMCKAIEDMIKETKQEGRQEEVIETARRFFENGG